MTRIQFGSFVACVENVMPQVDLLLLTYLTDDKFVRRDASSFIGWVGAYKQVICLIRVHCTCLIYCSEAIFHIWFFDISRHRFFQFFVFFFLFFSVFLFILFFLSKEYLRAAIALLMYGKNIVKAIFILARIENFGCKIDQVESVFGHSSLNFVESLAVLKLASGRSHLIISTFFVCVGLQKGCSFEGYKLMSFLALFWTYSQLIAISSLSPCLSFVGIKSENVLSLFCFFFAKLLISIFILHYFLH